MFLRADEQCVALLFAPEEARRYEGEINRLLGAGTMDIVNETGEEVEVKVEEARPTREEVLEGLRRVHGSCQRTPWLLVDIDRAIAYLEGLPAECLRAEQDAWDQGTQAQRDLYPGDHERFGMPTEPRGCR